MASIPDIKLNNIFEESILNNTMKKLYIEKMINQIPATQKYEFAIINKDLKKKKKKDGDTLETSIYFFLTILFGSLVYFMMSFLMLPENRTKFLFFLFIITAPVISYLGFYIKNKKKQINKNINNRVLEIKNDVRESGYKENIKNATISILNDLETIEGYAEEKNIFKNYLIAKQDLFENNKIDDLEESLKESFYEELTCVERDINNKMIIKTDFNNELIKMRT